MSRPQSIHLANQVDKMMIGAATDQRLGKSSNKAATAISPSSWLAIHEARRLHEVFVSGVFLLSFLRLTCFIKFAKVRNVTDLVDPPSPSRKPPKIWSAEQVRTFLEAVEGHRYYPIYIVAIYTGMRQGEILGIHKEDIDLKNGIINVRHQVQPIRGQGLTITEVKTDSARRPITLPDTALKVLKEHLDDVEEGLIFTTSTGRPISARDLFRHFKATIAKTGLPDIRFHDLRHSHASWLLQAGTNPKVVQERLGHSQISLTLDRYSRVIPSLQTEAAEQFESISS